MKFFINFNLNKLLIVGGLIALCFVGAFFVWWGIDVNIINNGDNTETVTDPSKISPITGLACEHSNRRPIAVMLASDPVTRPLSGISQADIVFEMPVTPNGITRMMAVYQCEEPEDIGSIRSARDSFIHLAAGLDAIFAHWGGEREALTKLDNHIINNIDAMIYENKYFYRKSGIKQPHDGFSDFKKLWQAVDDLKYTQTNSFIGYPHSKDAPTKNIVNVAGTIPINHSPQLDIVWTFDQATNLYRRNRGGTNEIDKNTGTQVSASVIIIMETTSDYISKDYNKVAVTGEGSAIIYQNGIKINGKWSKDRSSLAGKLFFYDTEGKEIEFTPGKIWVEIVT